MGGRYMVDHGVYCLKGTINPSLGKLTGLLMDDVEALKQALCNLFDNDESSARPAGSIVPLKMVWYEHDCPAGQYKAHQVFKSVQLNTETEDIIISKLPGLEPEIIEC